MSRLTTAARRTDPSRASASRMFFNETRSHELSSHDARDQRWLHAGSRLISARESLPLAAARRSTFARTTGGARREAPAVRAPPPADLPAPGGLRREPQAAIPHLPRGMVHGAQKGRPQKGFGHQDTDAWGGAAERPLVARQSPRDFDRRSDVAIDHRRSSSPMPWVCGIPAGRAPAVEMDFAD
jgi:hypothetical protein